ncbi:MAG: TIGR01777 family oxidoreductase [Spirochaetes bacterium]|jgi:hypothetical protein|nr:TIGR01777 family oxidoreductase [Spirochaetota bacterium]
MKVFITGGLGFVGSVLAERLVSLGHSVTVLNRTDRGTGISGVKIIIADSTVPGKWQEELAGHDAVINLAGASIFKRWTEKTRKEIYDSRIMTTRNVVDAIASRKGGGMDFFSASAVGYYGYHGDEFLDEGAGPGNDYLAGICVDWEREALRAKEFGSRVVLTRFGVILGKNGGALDRLVSITGMHLASVIGSGKQWFSWIHMEDVAGIFLHLIKNRTIHGPVNFTTEGPVTNRDFTYTLARVMKKRVLLPPVPGFALKLIMGEFGGFLIEGQRVLPGEMAASGYRFRFPELGEALADLVS